MKSNRASTRPDFELINPSHYLLLCPTEEILSHESYKQKINKFINIKSSFAFAR